MATKIIHIEVTGDNNIIITDAAGINIQVNEAELFIKYEKRLDEIEHLLQENKDIAYQSLRAKILAYQENANRSALDAYNLYLESSDKNQEANTTQALVGKTIEHLDKKSLKRLFGHERVKEHFQKRRISTKVSVEEKLRSLSLMTNGYLIKGTFLALGQISKFGVILANEDFCSFGSFNTLDKVSIRVSEQIYGNLVQQYEEMIMLIIKELSPLEIVDLVKGELDYAIPQVVVREILTNAFVHRDYNNNTPYHLMVEFYPDRMVVMNPGSLPPNADFSKPETLHTTGKNPQIARIFFLHGFIEMKGSGIIRLQNALKQREMRPAIFEEKNGLVIVTVYKKESRAQLLEKAQEYTLLRDYQKVLEYYLQIIAIDEKMLSNEHPSLATNYDSIAVAYAYLKKWENALLYQQKAITILLKILPFKHLSIRNAVTQMTNILYDAAKEKGEAWVTPYQEWLEQNCKDYLIK